MPTTPDRPTDFSAADSAVGDLYQVRLALLSALQRLASDETFALYLNTLDDVVFETTDSALDLRPRRQPHRREPRPLEVTARVDGCASLRNDSARRALFPHHDQRRRLGFSSQKADGSRPQRGRGTEAPRPHCDDVDERYEPRAAYELYRALSATEKSALLSTIVIAPRVPDIASVGDGIRAEDRLAARREHLDSFVGRLEGWWFRRALRQLVDEASPPLLSTELESEWHDLQEQFKRDALPVDRDMLEQEVDAAAYENAMFVR